VIFTDLQVISQTFHYFKDAFIKWFRGGCLPAFASEASGCFLGARGGVKASKTPLSGKSDLREIEVDPIL
jgi:hypothetical protein